MSENQRCRTNRFHLNLLDEEAEILKMKAYELGMSRSEFLRNLILFGTGKSYTAEDRALRKQLITEMNRIGNNLNQIAYNTNTKKSSNKKDTLAIIAEFDNLLGIMGEFFADDA